VACHVHLVAHNSKLGALGVAPEDLVALPAASGDVHRVVELRDAPGNAHVADLCTSERELPEVVSLLQCCDVVHLHGVSPRIGLHMLPCIKPTALASTTLVVHGPWPRVTATVADDPTRLPSWPGPVVFDALARRSHGDDLEAGVPVDRETASKADRAEDRAAKIHIDLHDARLLPVAKDDDAGPAPHRGPEDAYVVAICLSAEFGDAARDEILSALGELDTEGLGVELWDERSFDATLRSSTRRHAHACIAPVRFFWSSSRTVLEAIAQRIPVIAYGEALEAIPEGVAHAEDANGLAAAITGFVEAWRRGRAAPANVDAARTWLCATCQ